MWQDDTRAVPLATYEAAKDRWLSYFSTSPGVIRYGTFGSIGAPGLSDLDLVVIVKDESLIKKEFLIPAFLGEENYIFTHAPLIVPASLVNLLPYYHLIDVNWTDDVLGLTPNEGNNQKIINSLHVLSKTFYLQAFLWGLLLKKKRPCRRSILALTSVARSVQWLQRLSIPVNESYKVYTESILLLRKDWSEFPKSRDDHISMLDKLLLDALKITIELPEALASYLLGVEECDFYIGDGQRGLHNNPMNFILEVNVHNADEIISKYQNERFLLRLTDFFGKFSKYMIGSFAFSGPTAFSILDLEFNLSKNYRDSFGGYKWGVPVNDDLYTKAELTLTEELNKMFSANMKFAEAMKESGLCDSNFGNVVLLQGFKGLIFQVLARTMGQLGFVRRINSAFGKVTEC